MSPWELWSIFQYWAGRIYGQRANKVPNSSFIVMSVGSVFIFGQKFTRSASCFSISPVSFYNFISRRVIAVLC